MLFDTSSPNRKRVLRVVYSFLAILFAGGFILFGVGTETGGGGLFDALGITDSTGTNTSLTEQNDDEIEDLEERLATNPDDAAALARLAELHYSNATQRVQTNDAGEVTSLEEARPDFEASIEAWNRYVQTDPERINEGAGRQVVQAYYALGDYSGAAKAQELLAEQSGDSSDYEDLAFFHYNTLNLKAGDEAADEAVRLADKDEREALETRFQDLHDQVVKIKKRNEKARENQEKLENLPEGLGEGLGGGDPLGDLGGPLEAQ